jgi:hypothetical protein
MNARKAQNRLQPTAGHRGKTAQPTKSAAFGLEFTFYY